MSTIRQVISYLLIGGAQFLLDWALFSVFIFVAVPAMPANLAARASAAVLGFYLNGRITFASPGSDKIDRDRFLRFVLAWLLMTALSTALVRLAELNLPTVWLYAVKPAVEIALAFVNFFVLKRFVYR